MSKAFSKTAILFSVLGALGLASCSAIAPLQAKSIVSQTNFGFTLSKCKKTKLNGVRLVDGKKRYAIFPLSFPSTSIYASNVHKPSLAAYRTHSAVFRTSSDEGGRYSICHQHLERVDGQPFSITPIQEGLSWSKVASQFEIDFLARYTLACEKHPPRLPEQGVDPIRGVRLGPADIGQISCDDYIRNTSLWANLEVDGKQLRLVRFGHKISLTEVSAERMLK